MADTPGWVIALALLSPIAIFGTIAVTLIISSNHTTTTTFARDANGNIVQITEQDRLG